ncbi:DUF6354 family protein [Streptomyces virginiae]|uniref:DUF6354 family protein n=1 Tax=Streptomyces virginiae TaxID=1961 RepID=UPI0036ADA0B0
MVERDKQGTAVRATRPLVQKRFATRAFRLVEDAVDDADEAVYARVLAAMADLQARSASPVEYATAALAVHKESLATAEGHG